MVYTRSKLKHKEQHNKTVDPPTTTSIFKTLIAALESSEVQGIKSQLLRCSYYLLIQLSSKQQFCLGKESYLGEFFMKTKEGEVRVSIRDLYTLSKIFFMNLQKKLKQQSSKHDSSANPSHELEELILLLRCCMITLTFNVAQEHLLRSGRVFLLIFKKLSLLEVASGCQENSDFKKSLSCQCMNCCDDFADAFSEVASLSSLEIFDPCIPSITTILEVVIDELLVHGCLRKYLKTIDSISPANERLFKNGANGGDFGVMMEMIYSHFSLSIPDGGALQGFLKRILWVHSSKSKPLELSVIAARTLLQNPVVLSSPKLLQSHIVSVVSDVISVGIDSEKLTPDPKFIDCYLSVFESSVILYTQHMSILKTENHPTEARGSLANMHNSSQPSLIFCIDPMKRLKLDQKITTLNESWNMNLRRNFFKQKSDLVTASIEYLQQSLCIIDVSCRDDVFSFLKCMLMRAANDVNNIALPLNGDASLQDICLLASLLMLMSNSLIQTVWCLRYHSDQQRHNEYKFIVGIINCFKEFSIRLPIQKFSYNTMGTSSTSHNESRLMLIHFLGLLSLSFDSGLDFLVMSCVSLLMALTNLFVLEDGNIDALRSLADPIPISLSEGSLIKYKEPPTVCRDSTLGMAAKFQKIRTLSVRDVKRCNASAASDSTLTEAVGAENLSKALVSFSTTHVVGTVETCNGETYLKTRLKGSGDVTDFDDLADFVECKKGKDYVGWLKDRDKFRLQKLQKRMKHRWEKKKQAWRSMRGKT